jgi:hypothetical protein
MQRDDLSTDAEMLASMLASVEANAAVSASGCIYFHMIFASTPGSAVANDPTIRRALINTSSKPPPIN